jgi:hypothetical protein
LALSLREISDGRITVHRLSAAFNITRRTIERDIESRLLERLGYRLRPAVDRDFVMIAAENSRMQERIGEQARIIDNLRATLGGMTREKNKAIEDLSKLKGSLASHVRLYARKREEALGLARDIVSVKDEAYRSFNEMLNDLRAAKHKSKDFLSNRYRAPFSGEAKVVLDPERQRQLRTLDQCREMLMRNPHARRWHLEEMRNPLGLWAFCRHAEQVLMHRTFCGPTPDTLRRALTLFSRSIGMQRRAMVIRQASPESIAGGTFTSFKPDAVFEMEDAILNAMGDEPVSEVGAVVDLFERHRNAEVDEIEDPGVTMAEMELLQIEIADCERRAMSGSGWRF